MQNDEDELFMPIQQAQQPQPLQGVEGLGAIQSAISATEILKGEALNADGSALPGNSGEENKDPPSGPKGEKKKPVIDDARLNALIGGFYDAIRNEPIPEAWLKLLDQMEKQERK